MQCQTKDSGVIFPRESEKLLVTLAMRSGEWMVIYGVLLMVECYVVAAPGARLQQKAESTTPIPAFSPPEGNTTFIDGTTWCVARPGISQSDLQNALDWACGLGGADCSLVQPGAACYHPDTLLSHASYVFNSYYQQNGNSDIACYFGGTAAVVRRDPSYGSCKYLSSEPASASPLFQRSFLLEIVGILILQCLNTRLGSASTASVVGSLGF